MSTVVQLRPGTPRLLTKAQLAQHLKRSPRWIELRVREGMPVHAREPTGSAGGVTTWAR